MPEKALKEPPHMWVCFRRARHNWTPRPPHGQASTPNPPDPCHLPWDEFAKILQNAAKEVVGTTKRHKQQTKIIHLTTKPTSNNCSANKPNGGTRSTLHVAPPMNGSSVTNSTRPRQQSVSSNRAVATNGHITSFNNYKTPWTSTTWESSIPFCLN